MKLCSILVCFCWNFCEKKWQIWASEHHFGKVSSDARPWLMARWKAHVRHSIRVNWTTSIFAIYHGSGVMRCKVYSSAVFAGVDLFALNFYLDRVVPHQPFLASENRRHWATRRWRLHPSASPRFDIIPECDRQTDMPPIAYTPLAKLALPCAVIKIVSKSSRVGPKD